jgi:ATP-dependent DNA helicase RecQ
LENYYQEAGRAGRNGSKAYAILLANTSDRLQAEQQFLGVLPDKPFLSQVYQKLCADFQIAYGEGIDETFGFNLHRFCVKYNLPVARTYQALQFLDRQGILSLSQEFSEKLTLQFIVPSKEVIRYSSLHPEQEPVLVTLLRTHPGVYDQMTAINLSVVARKSGVTETKVLAVLNQLQLQGLATVHSKTNDAQLTFTTIREDAHTINRVSKHLMAQNELKASQLKSVLAYAENTSQCNQRMLLAYFGEKDATDCGHCSTCIAPRKKTIELGDLPEALLRLLQQQPYSSRELQEILSQPEEALIFALQSLLEAERIRLLPDNTYSLRN